MEKVHLWNEKMEIQRFSKYGLQMTVFVIFMIIHFLLLMVVAEHLIPLHRGLLLFQFFGGLFLSTAICNYLLSSWFDTLVEKEYQRVKKINSLKLGVSNEYRRMKRKFLLLRGSWKSCTY